LRFTPSGFFTIYVFVAQAAAAVLISETSMSDSLTRLTRKAILRTLTAHDNQQHNALRKAVVLECKGLGSKDERREAFAASLER